MMNNSRQLRLNYVDSCGLGQMFSVLIARVCVCRFVFVFVHISILFALKFVKNDCKNNAKRVHLKSNIKITSKWL